MTLNRYQLKGRILRSDDRTGVPGLTVEVIDNDHVFDDELGKTLTRGDGTFLVTYTDDHYSFNELYERKPEIYVRYRDRRNTIVYTGKDKRSFPPDSEEEFEIILDPEVLDNHYDEPLMWELPDKPLFSEEWLTTVGVAVGRLLADPGTETHDMYMRAARCALPPLFNSEELIQDAHGVLMGEPGAINSLRRTLDAFIEEEGAPELEDDFLTFEWLKRTISLIDARRDGSGIHPSRMQSNLIDQIDHRRMRVIPDPDASRTLVAAVTEVARDKETRCQFVGMVLVGLRDLQVASTLHETARLALMGEATPRELRTALRRSAALCGPDDGPTPDPIPDPIPPLDEPLSGFIAENFWWLECVLDSWLQQELNEEDETYTITEIDPQDACPGDKITIHGHDFGWEQGQIVFSTTSGPVDGQIDEWSDTQITVTVPEGARFGELELDIELEPVQLCDRLVTRKKQPTNDSIQVFAGGDPKAHLSVNGSTTDQCVEPGETVNVSWDVQPTDANVSLAVGPDSANIAFDDVDASGTQSIDVPEFKAPVNYTIELAASNACGSVSRVVTLEVNVVPTITVTRMEITQGIQSYGATDDVSNTLPTVAEKDTVVRVYIDADRKGFKIDTVDYVTGRLFVDDFELQPINGSTPTGETTRNPADPFITARPEEAINRDNSNHTLNFKIPASAATGSKLLQVDIVGPEICGTTPTDTLTRSWTWVPNEALPVRFVRIRDDRPPPIGSGTRPSQSQARFTIQRAFDLFPSPPTDIAPAARPMMSTALPFDTTAGVELLLDELEDQRACDAVEMLNIACDNYYWVGLTDSFNRGIAFRPGLSAISCIWRVSDGQDALRRVKTAHELGHSLSFQHVDRGCGDSNPVCAVDNTSLCFYDHPNNGTLQETPFDPFWHEAIDGSVKDFMSYGCTRWTSSDSWNRLLTSI